MSTMSAPTTSPPSHRTEAPRARRRAWLWLASTPLFFVVSFAVSEGLAAMLGLQDGDVPTFSWRFDQPGERRGAGDGRDGAVTAGVRLGRHQPQPCLRQRRKGAALSPTTGPIAGFREPPHPDSQLQAASAATASQNRIISDSSL